MRSAAACARLFFEEPFATVEREDLITMWRVLASRHTIFFS